MPNYLSPQPGSISFASLGASNIVTVPRDVAMQLMRTYTILGTAFEQDALGLYTTQSVGNTGEISFMSFTPPRHVFQPAIMGCAWKPKGRIGSKQTKLSMDRIEYNGEQCPDSFQANKCWERIFGVGVDINKFRSTPEGTAVLNELVRLVHIGLGNSYLDMVNFGQHPLITDADANGWFQAPAKEWEDYVDQQQSTLGHITIVDGLKSDGLDHYNVDIESFYDDDGEFTGDMNDFLDLVIKARTRNFKLAENAPGQPVKGIIRTDETTFDAFGSQLVAQFQNIPQTYDLYLNGESGPIRLRNAIKYKGYAVVPETSWGNMDEMTGTKTRRALMSFPGVFGIGYDVASVKQYEGMGLVMEELTHVRDKGRIDMFTTQKTGQLILDTDFVVNASFTIIPE